MTAETIEGEVVEVPTERALVVAADIGMTATGPLALAGLSDEEFDRRLDALDTMRKRVARMQKALMVIDVDYGVIPGTGSKPTLLKPGAEKLCQAYGLAADFIPSRTVGDGIDAPSLSYVTRCELHLGSLDGLVIAVGYGAANSFERKHRYRRGERVCPECSQPAIIKGKAEYGGGWVCFKKKGGCGHKWPDDAPEIVGQSVGDVENPDPFDLDVVLAKMSEKRAFVDATLRATAASGLFTQDVEDMRPRDDAPRDDAPSDPITQKAQQPVPGSLIGTLVTQGTQDFQLRESPDGWTLPFRVKEGSKSQIVMAHDDLAMALAVIREAALGERVEVWGTYTDEKIEKPGKATVWYKVLHLTRIQHADWTLPAATDAPTAPLFPDDDLSGLDF